MPKSSLIYLSTPSLLMVKLEENGFKLFGGMKDQLSLLKRGVLISASDTSHQKTTSWGSLFAA